MSNRRQAWPGTAAKTKVDAAKLRQLARTRPKRRRARKAAPKSSAPPQAQTNSQASKGENQTRHCSIAWRDKVRALARAQSVARATHCRHDCPGRRLQSAGATNKG